MPEGEKVVLALLRPFLEAWVNRDEIQTAKHAGQLMFWRSGMLKQLEAIAAGNATKKTFDE